MEDLAGQPAAADFVLKKLATEPPATDVLTPEAPASESGGVMSGAGRGNDRAHGPPGPTLFHDDRAPQARTFSVARARASNPLCRVCIRRRVTGSDRGGGGA